MRRLLILGSLVVLGCALDFVEPAPVGPPAQPFPAILDISIWVSRGVRDSVTVLAYLSPGWDSIAEMPRGMVLDTLRVGDGALVPTEVFPRSLRYQWATEIASDDSSLAIAWPVVAGVPTPPGSVVVRLPGRVGDMQLNVPPATDLLLTFEPRAGSAVPEPGFSAWSASLRGPNSYARNVTGTGSLLNPLVLPAAWLAEAPAGPIECTLTFQDSYRAAEGTDSQVYFVGVGVVTALHWTITRTFVN